MMIIIQILLIMTSWNPHHFPIWIKKGYNYFRIFPPYFKIKKTKECIPKDAYGEGIIWSNQDFIDYKRITFNSKMSHKRIQYILRDSYCAIDIETRKRILRQDK